MHLNKRQWMHLTEEIEMKDIIIYSAGGFGREVHVLIKQINKIDKKYNVLGFVDDNPNISSQSINGIPVLGDHNYLLAYSQPVVVAVALTNRTKNELVEKLMINSFLSFDNLIHPDIYWDDTNSIGIGNILCHAMNLTCNIAIGNFNIFNGKVGIGHDVKIGNFNLFGPNSFIAGTVNIGNFNIFAMNSSVIQQRSIGDGNTINLNSVIIKNVGHNGVYFGVPALKQTF